MSEQLHLQIGGVSFEIDLPAMAWLDAVIDRYAVFVRQPAPEPWRVSLVEDEAVGEIGRPWLLQSGEVADFRIAAHAGQVDFGRRTATVTATSPAQAVSALERTMAFICMRVLPDGQKGLLLHGVGLARHSHGYAFCGTSGRGKTTVARLAAGHAEVLCDENVILLLHAGGADLQSTPFWGFSTPSAMVRMVEKRLPLRAVFLLEHGPEFRLTLLRSSLAAGELLTTEKAPLDPPGSVMAWLAMVERLAETVPVYRLAFRPTDELWPFLEKEL